jgi:Cof subfamily protein (haloacid dehalogenase superfamily)
MPRTKLIALDLDGTLLGGGDRLDPRDVAAIAHARAEGVIVTIATGRLISGTLPTARALGLDALMVCADGTALVDAATGAVVERIGLRGGDAEHVLESFTRHSLTPFVFLHDAIHCDESSAALAAYARSWTKEVNYHPRLLDAPDWRAPDHVAMLVGLGPGEAVELAREALRRDRGEALDQAHFPLGSSGMWALRIMPDGCNKGAGLARLAERLGITRDEVAVVGDFWNDISMFQWAGRSFAMAQAPEPVALHATDRLRASGADGGGVAEAIARLGLAPSALEG